MSLLMLLSVTSGLTFTSFADDEIKTYSDFQYTIDGSDIYIYKYTGTDTEITIPSEIDGITIDYLSMPSVARNSNFEDVTTFNIPASVTYIEGFSALSSNTVFNFASGSPYTYDDGFVYYDTSSGRRLEIIYNYYYGGSSVYIPEGVTDISDGAFDYAPFSELYLPASMTELSSAMLSVFRYMYPESINISNNNPNYSSVDGVIFNKDKTELIFYPGMKNYFEGTYTVPDGVEKIGDDAFSNADIKEVILPDSIYSIGYGAFKNSSIEKISLPGSITEIDSDAFLDCAYYKDKNNWENNALYIDNYLIKAEDSEDYETFDIKYGTTLIADGAFAGYSFLKEVNIPNSVTSISDYAFNSCMSLADIVIPDSVTSIGDYAFLYCMSLKDITIPNSVTYIGREAFEVCASLTDIIIPDSVTSISESAFAGCVSLTDIVIPDSVTYIGVGAFGYCVSLTDIAIPNSVENIADSTFIFCLSLENVALPDSLKSIGDCAFCYANLKNINLPDNLQTIGVNAFYNLKVTDDRESLNEFFNEYIEEYIGSYNRIAEEYGIDFTFNTDAFTNYVSNTLLREDNEITGVTIPKSVTEIGGDAFGYLCTFTFDEESRLDGIINKTENFAITGYKNTAAETYANENGFTFIDLDENTEQPDPPVTSGDYEYAENDDGTITITGFTAPENSTGTLEIPSQIDGKTVTGIKGSVLNGDYEAVTIPETVTSDLDYYIFGNLDKLKNITVSENNPEYSSIDGVLFNKNKTALICCPQGKEGAYAIPDGVEHFADAYVFFGCKLLTEIFIPASMESNFGFYGYRNFIWSCSNLESINVDDNNENFSSVDGILYSKDKSVLFACPSAKNITALTVENGVKQIVGHAFSSCSYLESITIPNSVTSIGECAFSHSDSLKEVKLPESLNEIVYGTFSGCSALETIDIPDSVSYIANYAFVDCPNLMNVTLSKNVTEIDDCAFGYYWQTDKTDDGYYYTYHTYLRKIDGFKIYGYKGTAAEEYANENGFTFVDLDSQGECEHKNTVVKNAVSATCTMSGYTGDTYCADCNAKIAEGKTIPALGHKSETIKGKPATCTELGLTDGTKCSVCGVTLIAQKTIPALGHKSETVKGKSATCTEKGLTDGTKCSVCGAVIKEQTEIPSLGHTSEVVNGKPATCTEKGLTDGTKCSVCGEVIKAQTEISSLGHTSEVVSGKPATCTETGLTDGEKCSVCGAVIKEQTEIPSLGHKSETVKGKSATCTETGLTDGEKCSVCGKIIKAQTEISSLGHTSEVINGKPATCTEKGLTDGDKCSVCGKVIKEQTEIPSLGHTSEVINGKPATCTEKGLTDGEKCAVCGAVIKEQTEIPALGHKSETVKGKSATCTEKGLTDGEKCSVCGEIIKAQTEIPSLGHTSEVVSGKPATCTESGLTNGEKCSVCGAVIKEQTEIPALSHTFENGVCAVCGTKDPDFKLVLAENHDKNITLDNEKKTVTSIPASVNGMTAGELKSQFGAQIELDLDDSTLVPNGTKFKYNGEEYTIIVKGDVSADGKITAADARALLRIAAKLDNPDDVTSAAADLDSNGKITSTEARNILRFAARLSSSIDG